MKRRRHRILLSLCLLAAAAASICVAAVWRTASQARSAPPSPAALDTAPAALLEAAFAEREPPLRFAVLGDPESGRSLHRAALRRARRDGCAFVVYPGDLAFRQDRLALRTFLHDLASADFERAVFPVRGNHDDPEAFEETFGDWPLVARLAAATFVGIDSCDPDPDDPRLRVALRALREAPRDRPLFFVLHHPPVPFLGEDPGRGAKTKRILRPLVEALRDHPRPYVLSGHYHGFSIVREDRLLEVVTGGAGGDLTDGAFFHLTEIEVRKDGSVSIHPVSIRPGPGLLLDLLDTLGHDLYRALFGDVGSR